MIEDRELLFAGFDSEELITMDGYDDCIVGVVERIGQVPIVCYDKDKVIKQIIEESEMGYQDAREFFEFNQLGAGMGDATPCFLTSNE